MRIAVVLLLMLCAPGLSAQKNDSPPAFETGYLVLLSPGPSTASAQELNDARMAHGAYLMKLYAEKKAVVVAPFAQVEQDLGNAFGLVVLRVATAEEADAIMKRDETVRKGYFAYRLVRLMLPPA